MTKSRESVKHAIMMLTILFAFMFGPWIAIFAWLFLSSQVRAEKTAERHEERRVAFGRHGFSLELAKASAMVLIAGVAIYVAPPAGELAGFDAAVVQLPRSDWSLCWLPGLLLFPRIGGLLFIGSALAGDLSMGELGQLLPILVAVLKLIVAWGVVDVLLVVAERVLSTDRAAA